MGEELLPGGAIAGCAGDADAGGERQGAVVGVLERVAEAGGEVDCAVEVGVREKDAELFASHARGEIAGAEAGLQDLPDDGQGLISCGVAVAVVSLLEVVDVHEEDGEGAAVTLPVGELGFGAGAEDAAGGEAGEEVGRGDELEFGLLLEERLLLEAEFDAGFDLVGEDAERFLLVGPKLAGDGVDHAEGADGRAAGGLDGDAGVEAEVWVAGDKSVLGEAQVGGGVFDEEEIGLLDGVGAKGDVAMGLAVGEADCCFEPLAVCVDEGDGADGGSADGQGEADEVVELFFFGGVEEIEFEESCEAFLFGHAS